MQSVLFHVSDQANITCFEPRNDHGDVAVVWAIDSRHLPNYLLPRQCPRVCVRRGACEDVTLIARLLEDTEHAIYVENTWRERIAAATLFVYEFDAAAFTLVDSNAGYYQSLGVVAPERVSKLSNVKNEIASRQAKLHFVDSLWTVRDLVTNSKLEYSCIRMRNAKLREGLSAD